MVTRLEKRLWRKEMLGLINMDDRWYEKTESTNYKRIVELGKKLGGKVQTNIKPGVISEKNFRRLRVEGRTYKEIAEYFGVDRKTLQIWRERHGYIEKRKHTDKTSSN